MPGKRPFQFQNNNGKPQNNGRVSGPNPKKPVDGSALKNEKTVTDGPFYLYAKLTKAMGYLEKGLINKKTVFNAHIRIRVRGGEVSSLVAYYQSKFGDRIIKQINEKCYDADFDVPTEEFVGTHLKVTVKCKFKIGLLKKKVLPVSVFWPH